MKLFNFKNRHKQSNTANMFSHSKNQNMEDVSTTDMFVNAHKVSMTNCMMDARMLEIFGVKNIFDDNETLRCKNMKAADFAYCMEKLCSLYAIIPNAYKMYVEEYDAKYKDMLDKYKAGLVVGNPDFAIKAELQQFYSATKMSECFACAYAAGSEEFPVDVTNFDKINSEKEINDFMALLKSHLDINIKSMMIMNSFSGFEYVS